MFQALPLAGDTTVNLLLWNIHFSGKSQKINRKYVHNDKL